MEVLRTRAIGLGLCIALGLTACGGGNTSSTAKDHNGSIDHSIEVADGRNYDCFTYTTVNRGGISCERIPDNTKVEPHHNGAIAISEEVIDARKYDCFAYTTVLRGGLDCLPVNK